jgi:hypothetical protein
MHPFIHFCFTFLLLSKLQIHVSYTNRTHNSSHRPSYVPRPAAQQSTAQSKHNLMLAGFSSHNNTTPSTQWGPIRTQNIAISASSTPPTEPQATRQKPSCLQGSSASDPIHTEDNALLSCFAHTCTLSTRTNTCTQTHACTAVPCTASYRS